MPLTAQRPCPADLENALLAAGFAPLQARIYAARGISQPAQLEYDSTRLLPFTGLKNATAMAQLLADAIAARKRILVVADYDADGATACVVALRGLAWLGADVDFIVPNRFEYGYGLTPEIVQLAHRQANPDILLTVDNGIASVAGVEEANRLGVQVLVTDHHLPGDTLPAAACIVNPNQPGCTFPSKHLAGVGVMFYVLLALRAELRARCAFAERSEPNLGSLLDLVALGTVADVARLDDNNRILVHLGLQRIRSGRACPGINALLQIARRAPSQAATYELGFILGPRLNAAGRLDDMSLGIRCLLSDDETAALRLAQQLDTLNHERKSIESDMQESALATLENFDPGDHYTLTLFDESWHQGVIGILASRLKDRFHRPVVVFARSKEGELKGSGRSIDGLHLRDTLDLVAKSHPHVLQKFGGHAMAAGVTVREEHLATFQHAFELATRTQVTPAQLVKTLETDGELPARDFSLATAQDLARQVWGQGFPEPLFEGAFRVISQRVVGEKHLKLRLAGTAGELDAIRFFSSEPAPEEIHAVYSLSINEYNGRETLQLIVRHWQGE